MKYYAISSEFEGTICDFGCGAGDSFPVYRKQWPKSKLIGIDFSEAAINLCSKKFPDIAHFICGDVNSIPQVDIIICSNVLEHLDNDEEIIEKLLKKCKNLYVVVPYNEKPLSKEHIRVYDEKSFSRFNPQKIEIFLSKGWSYFGTTLYWNIYIKNVARFFLRRNICRQRKQIIFTFSEKLHE